MKNIYLFKVYLYISAMLIFIIFFFFLSNDIENYVVSLPPLLTFAARRTAWTARCWARFRFPNHPLTSRASWKFMRRACSIRRIPRTPMSRLNNLWRSTIAHDCTSISSVASTLWEANAENSSSRTAAMAIITPRRADIPVITIR